MFRLHIVHIATYLNTKFHAPSLNSFLVVKGTRVLADKRTAGLTDGLTDCRTDLLTNGRTDGKPIVHSGVNTGRGLTITLRCGIQPKYRYHSLSSV